MAKLNELAEFVDSVLRLDADTPVRGYNGIDIGPSNEQAQVLANRTRWLRERLEEILLQYASSVNGQSGVVDLNFSDVGAEKEGTAAQLIIDHEAKIDPHTQYLNKLRADTLYIKPSDANTPGGFLQLDSSGKIPASAADAFKAKYVVVATETARLALPTHDDLTICAQLNGSDDGDDQLYYLNAGDDPSVSGNWISGKSAVLQGVTSAFGRTGIIVAQVGDYNADQITETANRIFLTPAERILFSQKQELLVSGVNIKTVNKRNIVGSGDVTFDAQDVGADAIGTAQGLIAQHETKADPHKNYFNESRGDGRYLKRTDGNVPQGYLQLDASGKVPAGVIEVLTARYEVVDTEAERLALPIHDNLTICAQLNGPEDYDDRLYYLNANADPSVASNWYAGQSAVLQGVPSIFGRTGPVVAEVGDYDADKITETSSRTFISPQERSQWNDKQEKLKSGSNIKTFFGQSIIGSGNLSLTPKQLGSAAESHNHLVADITDYEKKTQELIAKTLIPGSGVTIGVDANSGRMIISAAGGSGGNGGGSIVVDRANATAGQIHSFSISRQTSFNLLAYALKEEIGSTNQTYIADDFLESSKDNYIGTQGLVYNGVIAQRRNSTFNFSPEGDFYSGSIPDTGKDIQIDSTISNLLVPVLTSNTSEPGFTPSASSIYNTNYEPYKVFDGKSNGSGTYWCSVAGKGTPTEAAPQWIAINLPTPRPIAGYKIVAGTSDGNRPTSWTIDGWDGSSWVTLHTVKDASYDANNAVTFNFNSTTEYIKYRINMTAVKSNANWMRVDELTFYQKAEEDLYIRGKDGSFYNSVDGVLTKVTGPADRSGAFLHSGKITKDALKDILPIDLVSITGSPVKLAITPARQIAIQKKLIQATMWSKINKATLTSTQSGSGTLKVAVSNDGVVWKIYKNNAWITIENITPDDAGAKNILTDGMSPAELTAITQSQWSGLYADSNGVPDGLAFAYGFDVTNEADVVNIDRLVLLVDNANSWKVQTPAEVEVRWRTDAVTFKTVTAGNYKLIYQIP